jgi:NTE family protein
MDSDVSLDAWDIDFDYTSTKTSLVDFRLADSLVLSGGGVKGVYLLGALEYLNNEVGFGHIKAYYGVSIGAVICALILSGYTPIEVMAQICVQKIQQKVSVIDKNIVERKSLFNPKHFIEILEKMITEKLSTVPTLKEFYEITGKDLYITTICLSTPYTPLYLHHSTHPDIPLSTAVHMSMSIPFAFGYVEYESKRYMDGGILDNFPIIYASDTSKRPFGICFKNEKPLEDDSSFLNEVLFVITLPVGYLTELAKKNCPKNVVYVEIDTEEGAAGFISFSRQNSAIYEMFAKGYHECRKTLSMKEKKD